MIHSLTLSNFRSYKSINLEFDQNLTVIVGPNAVGKTNLLESIFVACTTRSFRAADRELVHIGADFFKIEAKFDSDDVEIVYLISPTTTKKQLKLNSKHHSLGSLLGRNPVTLFEPSDMNLFSHSPTNRRRYLDIILSQTNPRYITALTHFRRILKQRNSLLHSTKQQRRSLDHDQLFIWDIQIVEHAKVMIELRHQLVDTMNPLLLQAYQSIAGDAVDVALVMEGSISPDQDILTILQGQTKVDEMAGFTTKGPHRDDLNLKFKGGDVVSSASRGETRSAILALKLAELQYIESTLGVRPILLLDDVFSELDKDRREHLMAMISRQQTFITTTELTNTVPENSYVIDLSGVLV